MLILTKSDAAILVASKINNKFGLSRCYESKFIFKTATCAVLCTTGLDVKTTKCAV